MLYVIIFLSGAVLMSFEMVGSRIMAPTFGTSIYVWGSLISTVMAALTLGYALGGKVADRRPSLKSLGLILSGAGFYIGSIPFWSTMANQFFVRFGPQVGSLFAAVAFFFAPSVLLAMVSPYGVRLATKNLSTIGNTSGRLSAWSSAGSIIGTLATSFFLIPWIGVRSIVHGLGILLLALAGLSLLAGTRHARRSLKNTLPLMVVTALLASLLILPILFPERVRACQYGGRVLMVKDSLYHRIIVDEAERERHLHFDRSYQSAIDLDNPLKMIFEYTSYLHLAAVVQPKPERALFIGLGGGLAPYRFLHDYPSLKHVDAVEIDPEVVEAARRYFTLPMDPRLHVFAQDGRLFVEKAAKAIAEGKKAAYDLVVIDAFSADAIPFHLTTREFQDSVKNVLTNDGVVAMNIISALDGPQAKLIAAMNRTSSAIFPQVYLFPVGNRQKSLDFFERNIILIATNHPSRWNRAVWQRQASNFVRQGTIKEPVDNYAKNLLESLLKVKAPILSDDYAPTDTLQHPL